MGISGDWRDSGEATLGFFVLVAVGGCIGVGSRPEAPLAVRVLAVLLAISLVAGFGAWVTRRVRAAGGWRTWARSHRRIQAPSRPVADADDQS